MRGQPIDTRLFGSRSPARPLTHRTGRRVQFLLIANILLAIWYFSWLLAPERIGNRFLFTILAIAELFNLIQAAGFWWTCAGERVRKVVIPPGEKVDLEVDVFVPVYGEPLEVVEPTITGATRLRGARVRVALLDDGGSPEMEAMAGRLGATYIRRTVHAGAKAGNLNHALRATSAPFVAVFDCDHIPDAEFLRATLGHFADPAIAFVQTPQYYANAVRGGVAAASWAQQALFFGAIARGKDRLDAMFCCGTNVVFRRSALERVGGFPEDSLTEDFELSIRLHARGWKSAYVPEVLAHGLGPEDMAAYISQQHRWARGCLSALPSVVRARLPWRLRLQYLLSAMFFLSGWSILVYMLLPVVRILTGAQPLASATADQFLLHFAPYYLVSLLTVSVAGAGVYTFGAFALTASSFWLHIHATVVTLLRRPGRFVVTPKQGRAGRQPRAVLPALLAIAILVSSAIVGLLRGRSPATLNNIAFVALHVSVLLTGTSAALRRTAGMARDSAVDRNRKRPAA
jgi:cellulose synthase (UDP-forming)